MKSRIPAIIFGAVTLFAIGLAASGFNPREFARKHGGTMRLSVATGNTGGVYYPYGGGRASSASRYRTWTRPPRSPMLPSTTSS